MKSIAVCTALLAGCTGPREPEEGCPPPPENLPLPPSCGITEVHVFAIHETRDPIIGQAQITLDRPGSHQLVLSAHEETHWVIELRHPEAVLAGVHVMGFHPQTFDGLGDVPFTNDSELGGLPLCADFTQPNGDGDCDTGELLEAARNRAGAPHTSLHGCFRASVFKLNANGSVTSDCDPVEGAFQLEHYDNCPAAPQCGADV